MSISNIILDFSSIQCFYKRCLVDVPRLFFPLKPQITFSIAPHAGIGSYSTRFLVALTTARVCEGQSITHSQACRALFSTMAAAIKMDELMVSWLASDSIYENILNLIEENKLAAQKQQQQQQQQHQQQLLLDGSHEEGGGRDTNGGNKDDATSGGEDANSNSSPRCVIPKFYLGDPSRPRRRRRLLPMPQCDTWEPLPEGERQPSDHAKRYSDGASSGMNNINSSMAFTGEDGTEITTVPSSSNQAPMLCVREQVETLFAEIGQGKGEAKERFIPVQDFVRITKDIFRFPTFFNYPLCQRLLHLWREHKNENPPPMDISPDEPITYEMVEWFWLEEMEPYDGPERFFRLCKKPTADFIERDDFLPFIKALLSDHPVCYFDFCFASLFILLTSSLFAYVKGAGIFE